MSISYKIERVEHTLALVDAKLSDATSILARSIKMDKNGDISGVTMSIYHARALLNALLDLGVELSIARSILYG